ncbi:SAM-dependent DNA methyltransferase [Mesorhizobium sp. B2-4-15]|uniref:class I SAM-dependent DNA methyltransferase n=1 Tax=Mesorhizobium sp. B2-4-15 TaxID=2589934 RepID=UPI001152F864|nr:N-6 DNA methylase [Mesorhizobium sp. B2-4-15]TPK59705.1 SAM-dependent DNA methyltransferase [Mesorhizobium sp. B2-4-15]
MIERQISHASVAAPRNESDTTRGFVARLWSLCNILRGDGVGYNQYISELTYLLFLKLAEETGAESLLPEDYRWSELVRYDGPNLLGFYQEFLTHLGAAAKSDLVRSIYTFPTTVFSHSENLKAVITGIDALNWHSLTADAIGVVYEGLLAKNSEDTRSGAGQYFTPRALVDSMVACMRPDLGELIQDPSVGTGGFLISADHFIRDKRGDDAYQADPPRYEGMEIERGTHRLCLMNAFLHSMRANVHLGDTLTADAEKLCKADVVLANPPFGTRAAGMRSAREDIAHTSSNRQLQFLQHIYRALRPNGRAAVVVPDNVLFEGGLARKVREELTELCNLQMVLKLPVGIFYAQNVSTHVLYFQRVDTVGPGTQQVWLYDLRSGMPRFNKRRPLARHDLQGFERAFEHVRDGGEPDGVGDDRLRRFTRAQLVEHLDEVATGWLDAGGDIAADIAPEDVHDALHRMLTSLNWISGELGEVIEALASGQGIKLKRQKL